MTRDDIALVAMHALIVNATTLDEESIVEESIVISAFEYAESFLQESKLRKEHDEIQSED